MPYAELTRTVTTPPDSTKNKQELRRKDAVIIGLQRDLTMANQQLFWARLQIQQLEAKLRAERIKRFGPASESLNDLQLSLLVEEPSVTADEVQAEAERPALEQAPERKKRSHGRAPLPAHLPRKIKKLECAPEACRCRACGAETVVIGYDESEQLGKVPAEYFVWLIQREKRACRACEKGTVVAAPLPARIIDKSLASDELIIDVLVSKYCDHLPLYRQEAILAREAGVEISRSTLDDWVMKVGERLQAVTMAMHEELLRAPYLQADETTVPVQLRDKSGGNTDAYLWQYGEPEGSTVFEFALTRAATEPKRFLAGYGGMLQTDGYQAYEGVGAPGLLHLGCWAHARRYFVDAVKVNKDDVAAINLVTSMDALFLIERAAREQGVSREERQELREKASTEWVESIHADCLHLASRALPESALGKAVKYTLNQWEKLKRCLEQPRAELSNNLAENSMRPIAVGRKNWLHIGSKDAGPKVAAILSVVESCRRLRLPVREYLADVLPGLEYRTLSQVRDLTPAAWASRRG